MGQPRVIKASGLVKRYVIKDLQYKTMRPLPPIPRLDANLPKGHSVILTQESLAPGPNYSQARVINLGSHKEIYLAGQIGQKPGEERVVEGGIEDQTRQALSNMNAVLVAAGATPNHVAQVTIYILDIQNNRVGFERAYGSFFNELKPARSFVEVANFPCPEAGKLVMIDAKAVVINTA